MLLTIFTNRWFLMVACTVLVFLGMYIFKRLYLPVTSKIENVKVKRGVNLFLGIASCFILAAGTMFTLCDLLGAVFQWKFVIASAIGATFLYLCIEKVFGESEVNELGKAFLDFISHSDMFDGKLSPKNAIAVAKKLFGITNEIDNEEAVKQTKAVDAVVERLSGFLGDGVITDAERVEADKLIKESGVNLDGNSTYEKYKALLNK